MLQLSYGKINYTNLEIYIISDCSRAYLILYLSLKLYSTNMSLFSNYMSKVRFIFIYKSCNKDQSNLIHHPRMPSL